MVIHIYTSNTMDAFTTFGLHILMVASSEPVQVLFDLNKQQKQKLINVYLQIKLEQREVKGTGTSSQLKACTYCLRSTSKLHYPPNWSRPSALLDATCFTVWWHGLRSISKKAYEDWTTENATNVHLNAGTRKLKCTLEISRQGSHQGFQTQPIYQYGSLN